MLVSILELVFLVSLLLNANNYKLIKTSYGTLRVEYFHSGKQIVLLVIMGIIGIFAHLISAVSAQRFTLACTGKQFKVLMIGGRCGEL